MLCLLVTAFSFVSCGKVDEAEGKVFELRRARGNMIRFQVCFAANMTKEKTLDEVEAEKNIDFQPGIEITKCEVLTAFSNGILTR